MTTKFNGASYIVQKGAAALFSDAGKAQVQELISHYLGNAEILREAAAQADLTAFGGVNAPYIWVRTPAGMGSWEFFDIMLNKLHVVVTPGAGFGANGEGYFRISAFNSRANAIEVGRRLNEELKP
jgi:LL-diaminopimelate aminotransferase